jgi:hypothetical protein
MQKSLPELLPEVSTILDALLTQAEQPERKQVVRVRLNKHSHRWYFSGEEIGLRSRVNDQLQWLAMQGWLRLHWYRYEEGNLLEAVDLVTQQPDALVGLYTLLGRVPLGIMKEELRNLLSAQEPCEGWLQSFLSWALAQLAANKSPAPLNLTDLQESRDLLRALSSIARLKAPTLERTLSVQLFGNSKRLAELRGGILTVLRTHALEVSPVGDDDWAVLQAHNVYRPPEYVPLTGPLSLWLRPPVGADLSRPGTGCNIERGRDKSAPTEIRDSVYLQIEPHLPSISLPDDILRTAIIASCPAIALITVENLTSFSELLFVRPPSVMVVFTSGFPSPALTSFLARIRAYRPDLPFLHWGDMDAGGFKILAHLRRRLGTVLPLGMDIETFETYRTYAQPLEADDKSNLSTLLADPLLADCTRLIEHLMKVGMRLEQEAVNVKGLTLP